MTLPFEAGQLLTADHLNDRTMSEWAAYTPTWLTAGVGADPALGNGSISGRWCKASKTVFVRIRLTWGSTTTGGSGAWTFSLPVTPAVTPQTNLGHVLGLGGSPTAYKHDVAIFDNDTVVRAIGIAAGDYYNASVPHTWTTGNFLVLQMFYEAA